MGSSQKTSVGAAEATGVVMFPRLSARRLLVLGGIGLVLIGMIFGDIFAVFVLHQNAGRVGESLAAGAHAAAAGNVPAVVAHFRDIGGFLENRGTKVDTHSHIIGFGYLALMLAILEPWIALPERAMKRLSWLFILGAGLLPVGVFLIHYVGLQHSPFRFIGWGSIFADLGGLFVIVATLGCLYGLGKQFAAPRKTLIEDNLLAAGSAAGRMLFTGGVFLILVGFLYGSYYAAVDLYRHEALDYRILSEMSTGAAAQNTEAVDKALTGYGQLQGEKAVKIAAHAHIVEFGLLAILLAFFQPYVQFQETWKRRWSGVLLFGSLLLPVCVYLEMRFGLFAGGLADAGGLLVILALLAMWIGILRYTGGLDAVAGEAR